ncbi:MAG: hypothetical protein ACLGGX_04210 [Bdellovibrionia bacterium]
MKRLLVFFVVFAVTLLTFFETAWADENLPENSNELIESELNKAQVLKQRDKLIIKVKDQELRLDLVPQVEEMKTAMGLKLPESIVKEYEARGEALPEIDPLADFKKLPPEKQQEFIEQRKLFLTQAARILVQTEYAMGAGSLIGDAFTFVKVRTKKLFGVESEPRLAPPAFKERSRLIAERMLQNIDYKLWSQAPLVIDSNEYGVQLAAGIVAVQGVRDHGGGGGEFLGLSVAYNKTNRALVFEISHVSDVFDHSKAAVGVVGINGFAGILMARRDSANPVETLKGHTFYPPALPAYSSVGPAFFSAGLSTSIGLPPPPLADLLTWTDTFERRALLRITVSPVMKGFVRVYVGDVGGTVKIMAFRVIDVLKELAKKVLPLQRRSCSRVFAS